MAEVGIFSIPYGNFSKQIQARRERLKQRLDGDDTHIYKELLIKGGRHHLHLDLVGDELQHEIANWLLSKHEPDVADESTEELTAKL